MNAALTRKQTDERARRYRSRALIQRKPLVLPTLSSELRVREASRSVLTRSSLPAKMLVPALPHDAHGLLPKGFW